MRLLRGCVSLLRLLPLCSRPFRHCCGCCCNALLASLTRAPFPKTQKNTSNRRRSLFPPTQASQELNAYFASQGFYWLVGETEVRTGPVLVAPGVERTQASIVHIKKCRYLEASGCVGLCVNLCKVCAPRRWRWVPRLRRLPGEPGGGGREGKAAALAPFLLPSPLPAHLLRVI